MSKVSANCKKLSSCKKVGNDLDSEIDGKYKIGCQNEHGEKWLILILYSINQYVVGKTPKMLIKHAKAKKGHKEVNILPNIQH